MTGTAAHQSIILKKNEDLRIRSGHPWVFSNEVQTIVGSPATGDVVEIRSSGNKVIGYGFYSAHSLIAVRLLSDSPVEVTASFFQKRIQAANELRRQLFADRTFYRLVYGESDRLPGLIVDRYNGLFVVQTFSAGMDKRLPLICDAIEAVFEPAVIAERNESPLRALEHLPERKGILRGRETTTFINEHGLPYMIDVLEGQKTGFFLDQSENRARIRRYSAGATVLDCFCNLGGFALNAAAGGAVSVLGLDSSEEAIAAARENATRNALTSAQFEQGDVFEKLKQLDAGGARFDVVVLDPPSFTRSRKNVQSAKAGYRELHQLALRVLKRGGILLTSSCSHHILPDVFLDVITSSARKMGRHLQLLEWGGAAPDHPVLPQMPETRYLKFGVFRVL